MKYIRKTLILLSVRKTQHMKIADPSPENAKSP